VATRHGAADRRRAGGARRRALRPPRNLAA
jgi:hypothetical protein